MRDRHPDDDIRRAAGHRGRYRLVRPVGASRFASLWEGEDTAAGEPVLVEVIRSAPPPEPDDAKLLRDRMAVAQDLPPHPGLLAVRSIHAPEPPGRLAVATRAAARARARHGIEEQQWLLVLDPFDGSTLDHRAAFGDLSAAAVCAIAAKVGEALQALHANGIAHGSVSATSVLVSDAGEIRLIDAVVGSWWDDRGIADTVPRDRRAEDVAALRRLVQDQLSPVAVPIPVRRLLQPGREATLDELVAALREAGSSATSTTADALPAAPDDADDPRERTREQRKLAIDEERRRERERVEAARRRAQLHERAEAEARAAAERRHAQEAQARQLEQERRMAREAEELRRQLEAEETLHADAGRPGETNPAAHERPPAVVVVPDVREPEREDGAPVPPSSVEEPERHETAARTLAAAADRPGATVTAAPPTEPDLVVNLPEPPPVPSTDRLDWASPAPRVTSALPPGGAEDRSAVLETEPTRWMKVAAVLASLLMFGAIGAAVYLLLRGG